MMGIKVNSIATLFMILSLRVMVRIKNMMHTTVLSRKIATLDFIARRCNDVGSCFTVKDLRAILLNRLLPDIMISVITCPPITRYIRARKQSQL